VNAERKQTAPPIWLTAVTVIGLSALVLAAVVLWTLVSAPQALVGAETPNTVLMFGQWAWHVVTTVAAWL
jgi:hypothetical protein